ncbi:MAG: hypothetical protein NTZ17_12900 [Phycisphaerae bacterium]|nr:hypothetical protein [Phycisphaerae bacterium]
MKVSNTVVSVVVIAAVLIFAYGVGMLIRQARTGGSRAPSSAQVKDAVSPLRPGPTAARTNDTPEERMRLKEEKAKAIEKMSVQTDEEKQKLRDRVIKQVGGRRGSKKRQALSSQERSAQMIPAPNQPESGRPHEDANTPASQGGDANTQSSIDKGSSEPGRAGPG